MNYVHLIGTMVRDTELKQYGDKIRGLIRIAVNKEYRNANGEFDSNFFNISVWGNTADYIAKYAPKGTMIAVTGRLDSYNKKDENGNSLGDMISIEASNVEIIKKAKSQQEQEKNTFNYGEKVSQNQSTQHNQYHNNNYPSNDFEVEDEDLPF